MEKEERKSWRILKAVLSAWEKGFLDGSSLALVEAPASGLIHHGRMERDTKRRLRQSGMDPLPEKEEKGPERRARIA